MKKKIQRKPHHRNNYPFVSGYLNKIFSTIQFTKTINKLAIRIQSFRKKHRIEAIAFTGVSGSAVAYPLSYKLKIPLICVRKGTSHYGSPYEGREDVKRYIIVDDLIETGNTIRKIKKTVKIHSPKAKCIGVFLYNAGRRRAWVDEDDAPVFNV
jgi:adenine/guanine phosphoribosyltransferase-like PRPP-binding protein